MWSLNITYTSGHWGNNGHCNKTNLMVAVFVLLLLFQRYEVNFYTLSPSIYFIINKNVQCLNIAESVKNTTQNDEINYLVTKCISYDIF